MEILAIIVLVGLAVGVCLIFRGFWENDNPVLTEYKLNKGGLPTNFKGFKIIHISDYHNAQIGQNNDKLLRFIENTNPDIIVVTGDIVDCHKTNLAVALNFAKQLVAIAPCYYCCGNHEPRIGDFSQLIKGLDSVGFVVLQNHKTVLERGGQRIVIGGISSPACYFERTEVEQSKEYIVKTLEKLKDADGDFTMLLSHHPEYAKEYASSGAAVVFSGHAHGGQFILPLIGGLYAPEQGVLPKYTQGVKTLGDTSLVISRGIGNSSFPFRVNNRPEVILVELE